MGFPQLDIWRIQALICQSVPTADGVSKLTPLPLPVITPIKGWGCRASAQSNPSPFNNAPSIPEAIKQMMNLVSQQHFLFPLVPSKTIGRHRMLSALFQLSQWTWQSRCRHHMPLNNCTSPPYAAARGMKTWGTSMFDAREYKRCRVEAEQNRVAPDWQSCDARAAFSGLDGGSSGRHE